MSNELNYFNYQLVQNTCNWLIKILSSMCSCLKKDFVVCLRGLAKIKKNLWYMYILGLWSRFSSIVKIIFGRSLYKCDNVMLLSLLIWICWLPPPALPPVKKINLFYNGYDCFRLGRVTEETNPFKHSSWRMVWLWQLVSPKHRTENMPYGMR